MSARSFSAMPGDQPLAGVKASVTQPSILRMVAASPATAAARKIPPMLSWLPMPQATTTMRVPEIPTDVPNRSSAAGLGLPNTAIGTVGVALASQIFDRAAKIGPDVLEGALQVFHVWGQGGAGGAPLVGLGRLRAADRTQSAAAEASPPPPEASARQAVLDRGLAKP